MRRPLKPVAEWTDDEIADLAEPSPSDIITASVQFRADAPPGWAALLDAQQEDQPPPPTDA